MISSRPLIGQPPPPGPGSEKMGPKKEEEKILTPSLTLGEWHIFGCACLTRKCLISRLLISRLLISHLPLSPLPLSVFPQDDHLNVCISVSSRQGRSQVLLYQHCREWFSNWVTPLLLWLYGAAKPKRLEMVHLVKNRLCHTYLGHSKYQTIFKWHH